MSLRENSERQFIDDTHEPSVFAGEDHLGTDTHRRSVLAPNFERHPLGEAQNTPALDGNGQPHKAAVPTPSGIAGDLGHGLNDAHGWIAEINSSCLAGDLGHRLNDTHRGIAEINLSRHSLHDTQREDAGGGDQFRREDQTKCVSPIILEWRRLQQLRRAQARLDLQAQAICRALCAGDKTQGGKLWAKHLKRQEGLEGSLIFAPFLDAIDRFEQDCKPIEAFLTKAVRQTALWGWAKDVRGIAEMSVARLIGELGALPGGYKSVSATWKRMGLAVIHGERQRRVKDADLAIEHGYSPTRRASAYVLATNLMRCQRAEDPYRVIYDRRKAYELARDIPKAHAHNRALRYMVKELLKHAWIADRRLSA